jgi:putative ABC transport system ATP-binding protein
VSLPATNVTVDLVRCRNVSRAYHVGSAHVNAVAGADCRVEAGTRVALTGASGSGKSTLTHLLAGLDSPTAGEVSWPGLGAEPTGRAGLVGVVFQRPSLLAPLAVTENAALPLLLAGVDPEHATARATAALARVGIADLGGKLPEELSGGQDQRVAVARVLASGPSLILADEPTGALDAAHATHVVDLLCHVAEELGAGLVISTHDPAVAERLPRRWWIRDGVLRTGDERREASC